MGHPFMSRFQIIKKLPSTFYYAEPSDNFINKYAPRVTQVDNRYYYQFVPNFQ